VNPGTSDIDNPRKAVLGTQSLCAAANAIARFQDDDDVSLPREGTRRDGPGPSGPDDYDLFPVSDIACDLESDHTPQERRTWQKGSNRFKTRDGPPRLQSGSKCRMFPLAPFSTLSQKSTSLPEAHTCYIYLFLPENGLYL
jgi:hypothetical protein